MTKKESAELIVKQDGRCDGIECKDCFGGEDCLAELLEKAKKYLEEEV